MTEPTYRRTPAPEPRIPGRLPSGRRLVIVVVGLVLLAVLALAIVLLTSDDDDTATPSPSSTTASTSTSGSRPPVGGTAPDVVVAGQVLPATLGPGWTEVSREAEPAPAEFDADDPCAALGQPIQAGLVVRAAFDHLGTTEVVEKAALVAGVVEEDTEVPRLDDPAVVECLQTGLVPQVAEGSDVVAVDQGLGPGPEGLELTGARFEVRDEAGTPGGRFDLLLLRRDRAVSFALIAVLDETEATPLADLVEALDAPLQEAAARLN